MAGNRKSGGGNVALTTSKRRSGGAWVDITTAKRRSGGVWVDIPFIYLANANQSQSTIAPNNAFARLEFTSSIVQGRVTSLSGTTNTKFTWNIGGSAASYEIRATYVSGTLPAGSATGTWHAGNSSPGWHLQQSTNGSTTGSILVEIRPAGGGATLASATFTLSVDRSP